MGSKEKDSKPLARIKDFFRKGPIGSHTLREYQVTQEQYYDLSKESPLPTRLKVIKDLCRIAEHEKFAKNVVEKLWTCIEDLFNKDNPAEARHMAFNLTKCMIKGQSERLTPMRAQFFRLIKHQDHPEDVGQKLDLLIALTQNGKAIVYFEEEIGRFLLTWFPEIVRMGRTEDYLFLIDNIIHFNAAYLDEEMINGFIANISNICTPGMPLTTMKACLKIMSSVVAYSNMSPEALPDFVRALCLAVVIQQFCETSWMIMKNLLGTHLGHSTIYTLCKILQVPCNTSQTDVLQGGVFLIRMGLWTMETFPNLQCPPSSILPSFAHAMKNNQPAVAYEVALALQQLVYRYGMGLVDASWSVILSILSHILQMDKSELNSHNLEYKIIVLDIMTEIEGYIEMNKYNGSFKSYYKLVEECAADRPEESVLRLLKYLSKNVKPAHHLWMTNLYNLMYKYFKVEKRTAIRVEALGILNNTYKVYRDQFEEELIERIIIPHLGSIVHDPDAHVRVTVINVLLEICVVCESKRFIDILDILSTVLFRPCENPNSPSAHEDIIDLIGGLTELFVNKIRRLPSSHALRIYHMLVNFLKKHYDRLERELQEKEAREIELQNKDPKERELKEKEWKEKDLKELREKPPGFEACSKARYMIFDCLFKLRADTLYHLGYFDGNILHFSSYLCIAYRSSANSPPTQSPAILGQPNYNVTYISLRRAFGVIVKSLKLEKDWGVLSLLITGLTKILQNKSLIIGNGKNDLDLLVDALCNLVLERGLSLPESLNVKVSKSDFHAMVSLSLVNLASYHAYLDKERQGKLIRCIIKCIQIAPKNSKPCISALTICTLEMKEVMVELLPLVLLDLSKMSPTNHVAVPILEFLSTMAQLPSIFVNFVSDQYMAVFAVALAYSNPFKFNHYIVSLAHHVIAVWFLKCRLNFRRDFVSFIIAGLKTNLQPYEDTLFHRLDYGSINQDSSDRKRSSSLTEQGSRRRDERNLSVRLDKGAIKKSHVPNKRLGTFYEELNETCIDLMARYAFTPCASATPRRTPVAEFLLNGGQSMTWLVGNKLITITTSGCSQKPLRQGLCEKCLNYCAPRNDKLLTTRNSSTEPSRQNSNDKSNNSGNSPQDDTVGKTKEESMSARFQAMIKTETKEEKYVCPCWCQNWAEVYIRRPTGVNSMITCILNDQNDVVQPSSIDELPWNEITSLYFPSTSTYEEPQRPLLVRQDTFDDNQSVHDDEGASGQASPRQTPSRQNSQDSVEDDNEDIMYEDGTRSRNPVRRSNSSPEMSAGWKNPFHKMGSSSGSSEGDSIEDKKGKMYSKDLRVSYEAIPEEIGGLGTSPPQSNMAQSLASSNPKSLLSCLSCPGSSEPNEPLLDSAKTSHTVPPSPGPTNQRGGYLEFPLSRPTTLPSSVGSLQPLAGKPPQSPTQTSPRLARHVSKGGQELQKSSSSSTVLDRNNQFAQAKERKFTGSIERIDSSQILLRRDKSSTTSITRPRSEPNRHSGRIKELPRSGVNPSFVFLQLYHNALLNDHNKADTPILIGTSEHVNRAVKILDKIPPYETHRVGVLYIREGQVKNEVEILKNRFGSLRYVQFLKNLGTLVKLSDTDPQILGGLEQNGEDGKFAYIWQDDLVRVTFHVATMMPNKETDPNCVNKKKHIGNDFVNIVYNESGEDYDIKTIKSQFNFASIIIQPLDHNINRVIVKTKDELKDMTVFSSDAKVVSDENVAILARQLALHANLASLVARSLQSSPDDPYASNWLERLRLIKNIRKKVMDERRLEDVYPSEQNKSRKPIEDFTEYC